MEVHRVYFWFFAMDLPVTYADVAAAARRLEGAAHRTPVLTSTTANQMTGAQIFFKPENLQRMGAFKFRGAYNAIANLTDAQRARGVLAFSSGNHAQAIALSARLAGVKAVIVMPADAPALKLAATRGYGAEVITYDRMKEDREALAKRIAEERGMSVIPPYNHPDVIAGQGTAAKELIEDAGPLDYLFVCLGGGGLTSGCALAAHELSPGCKVIGVEPEAGNDVQQSFRKGEIVKIPVPQTIADGAQTQAPGEFDLRDHPRAGQRCADGVGRAIDRSDALFCVAHENRGRADRLPGGGGGVQQADRPARQTRRRDHLGGKCGPRRARALACLGRQWRVFCCRYADRAHGENR